MKELQRKHLQVYIYLSIIYKLCCFSPFFFLIFLVRRADLPTEYSKINTKTVLKRSEFLLYIKYMYIVLMINVFPAQFPKCDYHLSEHAVIQHYSTFVLLSRFHFQIYCFSSEFYALRYVTCFFSLRACLSPWLLKPFHSWKTPGELLEFYSKNWVATLCSELTIKTREGRQWRFLVSLLLTLKMFHTFF